MQHWRALGLILGLVLINAFFAAGEIAVVSARPVRIRQLAEQGNPSAWALLQLMKDQSRFLATIQVGITLAGFLASASAAVGLSAGLGAALQRLGVSPAVAGSAAVVAVTLLLSYLTLVLGELVPKRIALQSPERVALLVARPVLLIARLTRPFVALLTASTNLVVRLLGGQAQPAEPGISEEELRLYVAENTGLQEAEKRMIAGVFSFGDRSVRQVMVPRTEMACLHQDAPLPEALAEVRRHGFWRYPVYREDYDDIVGMVTVKDLLRHADPQAGLRTVADVMRPAWFVPESKQALSLLKEMQAADEQLAVVVDEYGGVSGLVTMEDLLEEIIGEIAEEPSPPSAEPRELELDGGEPVDEVAEQLHIPIPRSPHYETLAGYILHHLGAIPSEGDELAVSGWRLRVVRMDGHRIDRVRAVPDAPDAPGASDRPEPPERQGMRDRASPSGPPAS
ncbi:hemolysin family protein [Symbiobacterium thermophilum]|uniref:Putative hemolysin n=1 Tax=Symbiobacterium thermophilum (strain DSM 24528 / JCM 14929 / IAM 14863 / T) TaxID=292459 RepID=Q67QV0_SYMTH|nr:hemolysin family protein [Symbiobacterium thermophilum]BAD39943.1 putative hemolysin [Symbiobacterium thermophilum IAM 14863]